MEETTKYTLEDVMASAPNNEVIKDALFRTWMYISEHQKPLCSVSGGADSDVILDICYKCDPDKKVTYVWYDTGLEYKATKEHLKYLEEKYEIEILRYRAVKPIPFTCYTVGVPLFNKYDSEMIYRLQRHGFQWEDEPFEELVKKYPKCRVALKWWCNQNGNGNQFNIQKHPYLKEYIVENPINFKVSNKCCDYAKKNPAHKMITNNGFDLNIIGIRKAEGGVRATSHKSCFNNAGETYNNYYPVFWFSNADRAEYIKHYGITLSKCYTEYGMPRTGCAGCPYAGKNLQSELEIMKNNEPLLYQAVNKIFKNSYEYTKNYKEFAAKQKQEEKDND
jgi:3'-phosphoadenosine 5'-phosphosulfate sulfotransferase (PAPS reductase)/FAD synthetase